MLYFNFHQQTPFGQGHSEDFGKTLFHFQWEFSTISGRYFSKINTKAGITSNFPELIFLLPGALFFLILRANLQAIEAHSIQVIMLYLLYGVVSESPQ